MSTDTEEKSAIQKRKPPMGNPARRINMRGEASAKAKPGGELEAGRTKASRAVPPSAKTVVPRPGGVPGMNTNASGEPKKGGTGGGRPDKRTDAVVVNNLKSYLLSGNTLENSCILAGIDDTTLYRWMNEGAVAPEGTLASEFYRGVKEAMAQAEHRNVVRIQKGTPGWQSSAWFLERRNHQKWGRRDVVQIGNEDGKAFGVKDETPRVLSDAGAVEALKRVMARRPGLLKDIGKGKGK